MSENVFDGPRSEYLARIRRFTDEMLDRLNGASLEKDVDENQIRALRNVVLKVFRLWDKALLEGQHDPQLESGFTGSKSKVRRHDWRDLAFV